MKDRRKKVFLMSVLSFLFISGGIYIFFIIEAVNDIRTKPYFRTSFSARERALIPILKYLKIIDTEVVPNSGRLTKEEIAKMDEIFSYQEKETDNISNYDNYESYDKSGDSKYNSSGIDKRYVPKSKLSSQLNSDTVSFSGKGSSQTQSSNKNTLSSSFSSSESKNISVVYDKKQLTKIGNDGKSGDILSRLNDTKNILTSALKSKSADKARLDWDKGFVGSIKADNKMIYKDSALALDRVKGEVLSLKTDESKGLVAPEVGTPKKDNPMASADQTKELMKSLIKDTMSSMINAIGNGIAGGMSGGYGEQEDEVATTKGGNKNDEIIQKELEKWKFDPSEKVETAFFPCGMIDCKSMGIEGGGIYKAFFPDGFVLSLNSQGGVLDYYYCVSPNNEDQFLANYQKYVVGQ